MKIIKILAMALLVNGAICSAAELMTKEQEFLSRMDRHFTSGTLNQQIVGEELMVAVESSELGILTYLFNSSTIPADARLTQQWLNHALATAVLFASAPADQTLLDNAQIFIDRFLSLIPNQDDRIDIIDGAFIRATSMLNERAVQYFLARLDPRVQAVDEAYEALQLPEITEEEEAYRMFQGFDKPIETCRQNILILLAPTANREPLGK
jgi:hypothetical protein